MKVEKTHDATINSLKLADSNSFVTTGEDKLIKVWALRTGVQIGQINLLKDRKPQMWTFTGDI
jgi:WD40 repeat protein